MCFRRLVLVLLVAAGAGLVNFQVSDPLTGGPVHASVEQVTECHLQAGPVDEGLDVTQLVFVDAVAPDMVKMVLDDGQERQQRTKTPLV